jgi:hypothetical protein
MLLKKNSILNIDKKYFSYDNSSNSNIVIKYKRGKIKTHIVFMFYLLYLQNGFNREVITITTHCFSHRK